MCELARGLRDRDARAAGLAWDRYAGLVRGLLVKTTGATPDTDDLLQEVFITLWRRAPDLRDPSALTSFVVGITVRTARTELRRRRLKQWLSFLGDDLPESFSEEIDFEARQALSRLHAVLDKLGPDARMIFLLRHAEGLELSEIAVALEVSLATVKRKLGKANERVLLLARKDAALMDALRKETP